MASVEYFSNTPTALGIRSFANKIHQILRCLLLTDENAMKAAVLLQEAGDYARPLNNNWWSGTAKEFADGNVAMALLFTNYASNIIGYDSKVINKIGYAPVPGGNPLVGGGVLGISKRSAHAQEALEYMKWLNSEAVSGAMSLLGNLSPCSKTYQNYEVLDIYPWLSLAKDCFAKSRNNRMPHRTSKPFDQRKLMNIIGMAVNHIFIKAMAPKEALEYAMEAFSRSF